MIELKQIYKCGICGNMVEVVHVGGGTLVCCGQPMNLLTANTTDAAKEKHVPIVSVGAGTITVKVGSVPHPMEAKHFIEFIEVMADGKVYRQHLKPGDKPEAVFSIAALACTARAYCNLHGLWQS
jgi:superoxide reductase